MIALALTALSIGAASADTGIAGDSMLPPWAITVGSVFLAGVAFILWANRAFLSRDEVLLRFAQNDKALGELAGRVAAGESGRAATGTELAALERELAVLKQNQRWLISLTQSIAAKVGATMPPQEINDC